MRVQKKKIKRVSKIWMLFLILFFVLCALWMYMNRAKASDDNKLQNGSFEEYDSGITWKSGCYSQPTQDKVTAWNTTAYNTSGKNGLIELFKENSGTYINNVLLKPKAGYIAAELNADEESTLYQNVTTVPSSIYEWGLDHGARNGTDTMALVIGPKQSVDPSKPSKTGRDQLMQMVDWLIDQGMTSVKTSAGLGEQLTVYSKKFAENGTFADNTGNNAFSLTPSTIYTEEWRIWIMASSKATSGTNPWNSYGSNAEGSAGSADESGNTEVDTSKYYLYTVPAGQTKTLFGFVSVGCRNGSSAADKTYGNFLDNINFQIYHPLSGSSTTHGSAVVGGSDGGTDGVGATTGQAVTVDKNLITYATDGKPLKIQAVIKAADAKAGCEFVGVYYTIQDENGNPVTEFLKRAGNEIEDTGSLTDADKEGKWVKSTNAAGDIFYSYQLADVTTATDLHFVFIKSPTITYDSNGGKAYVVERTYNTTEAENVYSFKPYVSETDGSTTFISPYVSKAAEGQNDGWKFMGWLLTGDTGNDTTGVTTKNEDQLNSLILPAVHTIACDYSMNGATDANAAQYVKIYNGNVSLTEEVSTDTGTGAVKGVTWKDNGESIEYANVHKGLTMVAQWRWRQAFVPQVGSGSTYSNSDDGGTVEITSVTDTSDANYDAVYKTVGKSYHATTDETVTAKATANDGYTFEGWYDASGKFITTNATYSYTVTKESVNTYYARFSKSVTQTYTRQVKSGDSWVDTTDDAVGTLGRYTYTDYVGTSISSTAKAGTGYKFVGWYDSDGKKVADTNLTNDGATLSYTTTGDATYYARFETAYTVKFVAQTKQADGSFKNSTVGGKVSTASVTDVDGASASSSATKNTGYKFLGWYDKDGNKLSSSGTYSTTITSAINGVTYYARFEVNYNPQVESQVYLSFIAESEGTQIPSVFDGRDAGTGKDGEGYGLDSKYGNTISTGFKYSLANVTDASTIQISVTVPDNAYVKVGGTGSFSGKGTPILTDSAGVQYNKGSIQQISSATTLNYYWDATGLQAGTTYGFVIDNLYAPGATATITVNGTTGTHVTNDNGVVNTSSDSYRGSSHYEK